MIKGLSATLRDILRARYYRSYRRRLPPLNDAPAGYVPRADALIHPTALVSPEAELESGVVIGPFAVVEGQTRIGAGSQIGAHCVIKRFTSMGTGNRVYEHAVLGGEPQDVGFRGEESYVVIGDENVIREGVTIHRAQGAAKATVIGSRNYLMGHVHIAHNCEISDRVGIANGTALAGHVRVENDAYISGQVGIVERCRIGRRAMVVGLSGVGQDVLPFCTAVGAPAGLVGLNLRGLRRARIQASQIRNLKLAYRLLSARGPALEESLEAVARLRDPLVDELIVFVRSSTRGFCRARRPRARPMRGADDAQDATADGQPTEE
jgi:UDP-N-acetylglucosamine acyltransferase